MGPPKPKAVIYIGCEQWTIKFFNSEPIVAQFVEHAGMMLAQKVGINVAQTQVIKLADFNALAINVLNKTKASAFIACLQELLWKLPHTLAQSSK